MYFPFLGVFVLFAMTGCGMTPELEQSETANTDNLSVMRGLIGEIGNELNNLYGGDPGDTLVLEVDSSAAAWLVRSELASVLESQGKKFRLDGSGDGGRSGWNVHGIRLGVTYSDIRKPGIFSEAFVDREVRAEFTTEISKPAGLIASKTSSRVFHDTVRENDISTLENAGLGFTRGTVPDLKSWDRFIEPFVIIGAAGTAIFLFFQVRS